MTESNFKKKQQAINEKTLSMRGTTDKVFLKTVYNVTFLDDEFENSEVIKSRLRSTIYNKDSELEILNQFLGKNFANLNRAKKENLFQEVLNRHIKSNNYEPRYICSLEDLSTERLYACIFNSKNLLLLNNTVIDKYLDIPATDKESKLNCNTVGPYFLMAITHEAQHNVQSDLIIDYFLDNELDNDNKNLAAISLMTIVDNSIAYDYEDKEFINEKNETDYFYYFDEHNSNFIALQNMKKLLSTSKMKDLDITKTMAEFASFSLDSSIEDFRKNFNKDEFIAKRISKMQQTIEKYLTYMKENTYEDDFRNKLVKDIEDYLVKDELTNESNFEKLLKSQLSFMVDCVTDYIKQTKKSTNKNNLNEEISMSF